MTDILPSRGHMFNNGKHLLVTLHRKVEYIMATLADIKASLDALVPAAEAAISVGQVPGGSVVVLQSDLDAVAADVDKLRATLAVAVAASASMGTPPVSVAPAVPATPSVAV